MRTMLVLGLAMVAACKAGHADSVADARAADAAQVDSAAIDGPPIDSANDAAIDAPVDAPPASRLVTVHATGSIVDIEYRDGSAWATPTPLGEGAYQIEVHDAYLVLVVCSGGGFDAEEYGATAADGDSLEVGCAQYDAPAPQEGTVWGALAQDGTVYVGRDSVPATAQSTFEVTAPYGVHDVVAVDGSAAAIVRDVDLEGSKYVGIIDPSATGAPTMTVTETADGAGPNDDILTQVDVVTAHDDATIFHLYSTTPTLVSPSLLGPGEAEIVTLSDVIGEKTRTVETYDPTVTTLELPPQVTMTGVDTSGSAITVGCDALPLAGETTLSVVDQYDGETATVHVSAAWLAATGATSLGMDVSSPGWQADWSFWVAYPSVTLTLTIVQPLPTGAVSTSDWEWVI